MLTSEYCAGFFDGEGSVYAANRRSATVTRRPSPSILVCITNTNAQVLNALKEQWGGSVCGKVRRAGHQAQYQWVLSSRMAYPFLLAIHPHLIIKREVVAVAIRLCEEMRRPAKERWDFVVTRRADGRMRSNPVVKPAFEELTWRLHADIRRLNTRGAPFNVTRRHGEPAAAQRVQLA